jgi:hypothetical protein
MIRGAELAPPLTYFGILRGLNYLPTGAFGKRSEA